MGYEPSRNVAVLVLVVYSRQFVQDRTGLVTDVLRDLGGLDDEALGYLGSVGFNDAAGRGGSGLAGVSCVGFCDQQFYYVMVGE